MTDISKFLSDENNKLDRQMVQSGEAFNCLTVDLDKLQAEIGGKSQFK